MAKESSPALQWAPPSPGQGSTHHSSRQNSSLHGTCTYDTPQRAWSATPQTQQGLTRPRPSSTHSPCWPDPCGMKARGDAHTPGGSALCQLTTCMLMLAPSCSMSSSPRATHAALVLACASPQ